jgi:hypothetical protein
VQSIELIALEFICLLSVIHLSTDPTIRAFIQSTMYLSYCPSLLIKPFCFPPNLYLQFTCVMVKCVFCIVCAFLTCTNDLMLKLSQPSLLIATEALSPKQPLPGALGESADIRGIVWVLLLSSPSPANDFDLFYA